MLPNTSHTLPVWSSTNAKGSMVSFIPVNLESVMTFSNLYGPVTVTEDKTAILESSALLLNVM